MYQPRPRGRVAFADSIRAADARRRRLMIDRLREQTEGLSVRVLAERIRRAATPKVCALTGVPIQPGDTYRQWVAIVDGAFTCEVSLVRPEDSLGK